MLIPFSQDFSLIQLLASVPLVPFVPLVFTSTSTFAAGSDLEATTLDGAVVVVFLTNGLAALVAATRLVDTFETSGLDVKAEEDVDDDRVAAVLLLLLLVNRDDDVVEAVFAPVVVAVPFKRLPLIVVVREVRPAGAAFVTPFNTTGSLLVAGFGFGPGYNRLETAEVVVAVLLALKGRVVVVVTPVFLMAAPLTDSFKGLAVVLVVEVVRATVAALAGDGDAFRRPAPAVTVDKAVLVVGLAVGVAEVFVNAVRVEATVDAGLTVGADRVAVVEVTRAVVVGLAVVESGLRAATTVELTAGDAVRDPVAVFVTAGLGALDAVFEGTVFDAVVTGFVGAVFGAVLVIRVDDTLEVNSLEAADATAFETFARSLATGVTVSTDSLGTDFDSDLSLNPLTTGASLCSETRAGS